MKNYFFACTVLVAVISCLYVEAQTVARSGRPAATPQFPCTWTDPNTGDIYNLAPLVGDADYYQNVTSKKWWVYINICRTVVSTACGTVTGGVGGCQVWQPSNPTGKAVMGLANSISFMTLQNQTYEGQKGLTFTGGGGGRSFTLDLQCVPNAGVGTPLFEEEVTLSYNFGWQTQYACPLNYNPGGNGGGGGGLSGGSIILIIVLCLMVVYVAAGVTFNKVKKQATGLELIPNVEFWTSLPGLVKDGAMFIVNKTCRRGGYSQV